MPRAKDLLGVLGKPQPYEQSEDVDPMPDFGAESPYLLGVARCRQKA